MRKLFVLMAAVAFVVAFTLPAAAEVSISGSAEMNAWFDSQSKEVTGTGYDDDDLFFGQDANSNISFAFKNGAVGGKIEMRYGSGGVGDVRHWYGTYTTGLGTWVFGQTGPPTDVVAGVPKRGFGVGSGNNDASRQPGIQLWTGGLKVALLSPNVHDDIIGRTDTDTSIPAIEASYGFTAGPVGVTLFAGYNTYDEVNATDQSYSVDSMVYGGLVKFAAGPATIQGTLYMADNPNEGLHTGEFDAAWDGTAIRDASVMGYNVVGTYRMSDMLSFNASYGYDESEVDLPGTNEDDESTYYVNAVITLAKGVTIAPEYGKVDHGDRKTTTGGVTTTTKNGDESWFGAEFKITF